MYNTTKERIDPGKSMVLNEISRAAYPDKLYKFESWQPDDLKPFNMEHFTGFVTSNEKMTVVSFRGTHMNLDSYEHLKNSIGQWLRNLDYAQVQINDYRVHRGYFHELTSTYDTLVSLIKNQYSDNRKLYLTGHSAGAALATLIGNFLAHDKRVIPAAVYAYSSPRVGDMKFNEQYPIPLFRFERGYDVVPHLPLSPFLAKSFNKVGIDRLVSSLYQIFKFLGADVDPERMLHENVEYVHAGKLYYHENDHSTYLGTPVKLKDAGRDLLNAILGKDQKVEPEPEGVEQILKETSDMGRLVELVLKVKEELKDKQTNEEVVFVRDHKLDSVKNFIQSLFFGGKG